jgi:riboflavin kinase/FMN adenylyltransferase
LAEMADPLVGPREDMQRRLLAIGNFDGVHRGHQQLLRRVLEQATAEGLRPTVLTFDPHPARVLGRDMPPPLTHLERKRELISAVSPELELAVEPFNQGLADMTPESFVERVLVERYAVGRVIVGQEFRFGKGRQGTLQRLSELGQGHGFSAQSIELETSGGAVISSSRVRAELQAGAVGRAAELLGRLHSVEGVVVRGAQLGRSLGFPTANCGQVQEMLPAPGVYACWVNLEAGSLGQGRRWGAVANLGFRPTLTGGDQELRLEVHLFHFAGDLYGRQLRVEFVMRLRGERAFPNLEQLRAQIEQDAVQARACLAEA